MFAEHSEQSQMQTQCVWKSNTKADTMNHTCHQYSLFNPCSMIVHSVGLHSASLWFIYLLFMISVPTLTNHYLHNHYHNHSTIIVLYHHHQSYNQPVHLDVDIHRTGKVEAVIWQNPNQYPQKATSEMLGPTEHTTNKQYNTRLITANNAINNNENHAIYAHVYFNPMTSVASSS